MRRLVTCLLLLSAALGAADLTSDPNWWKSAIIYEVYPRSFGDTNGDGIGDLNGITAHLDYLKDLGVDAIWIAPFFPSPLVDFGYDVSDYRAIDPQFGTMADFDRLVAEAKKRGMGIVGDIVLNHTSDKHPWFVESKSSRTNAKADWYVWSDGKDGQPPNNWISLFGGSAWELVPARKQFYYHRFYKEQPDLNWRNREVRNAMYDVCRFWLRKGMAGIRLDALTSVFENEQLKDEPFNGKTNEFGDRGVKTIYTDNYGPVHEVLKELRQVSDEFPGRVLIGETYVSSAKDLLSLYGTKNDELQLPMDTQLGFLNQLSAPRFRKLLNEGENELGGNPPLFVFENHDNSRSLNRYGDGTHDPALAKLLATVLLMPRDAALLYYGQEIGMVDHVPTNVDQVQDPKARRSWPKDKGRDAERTPMQWNSSPQAGFSKRSKTWLPVGSDYKTVNVAAQEKDPNSILNYYKKLIQLKKTNEQLRDGNYIAVDTSNPSVLSFLRKTKDGAVLVSANMTKTPQTVKLNLLRNGITSSKAKSLVSSFEVQDTNIDLKAIKLPEYGAIVAQIQ